MNMFLRQSSNCKPSRIGLVGRLIAAGVFATVAGGFAVLNWGERGNIDWRALLNPCGFKQRHRLPCPACGMTTSVRAFARGEIRESFSVQPAGGLLCLTVAATGLVGLYIAVTGRGRRLLERVRRWKAGHVAIVILIILVAAWAVTLTRAAMVNY